MKKWSCPKLTIRRETLAQLGSAAMADVAGGVSTRPCTVTCPIVSICLICTP